MGREPPRRIERRMVSSFLFGRCRCVSWLVFSKRSGLGVNAPEYNRNKRRKLWTKDKKRREGNVMCCITGPSLIWHPLHHPAKTKQCPDISLEGAEGRADREKGKLGNQMWSIKTYWHAKGLLLPHSHTRSTNSYSSPRCMCGRMHMSPWLYKTRSCSCMSGKP